MSDAYVGIYTEDRMSYAMLDCPAVRLHVTWGGGVADLLVVGAEDVLQAVRKGLESQGYDVAEVVLHPPSVLGEP